MAEKKVIEMKIMSEQAWEIIRNKLDDEEFKEGLSGELWDSAQILKNALSTSTNPADYRFMQNWELDPGSKGYLDYEVGNTVHYAPYVEFGTRPHFPPWNPMHPEDSPIYKWVAYRWTDKYQGKYFGRTIKEVAWLICRRIAEYGTEGKHMVERIMKDYEGEFTDRINDYVKDYTEKG